MKTLNTIKIITLVLLFTFSTYAYSQSEPIRFQFQRGAISGEWNGIIHSGEQNFVIRLGQSQSFTLISQDVYTWSLVTPNATVLGCNDTTYCNSGDSIYLPMAGDYIVMTDYRMSDCYNCPVSKSRLVKIVFTSDDSIKNINDLKFKMKHSYIKSNIKNLLQCVKYKSINFTCAGTANYDNCMVIRFGQNYSDFSEVCSD